MSEEQYLNDASLRDVESEFAKTLLSIAQKLTGTSRDGTPVPFPNGIGDIELNASVEPQKISFSLKVTDAGRKLSAISRTKTVDLASSSIGSDILNYCISLDTNDDPVMHDCNAFVKKVAKQFGVTIDDGLDADGIVNSFGNAPFTKISMDPATAMLWANDGLVVAGMRKSDLDPTYGTYSHGHVAIVHNIADQNHPGFPMASWGTLGQGLRGKSDTSIRQSFPAAACDDNAVHFAFAPIS